MLGVSSVQLGSGFMSRPSYEATLAPDLVELPAHASKRTPGTGVAGVFVACAVRSEICSEALEPDQNKKLTKEIGRLLPTAAKEPSHSFQ